MNKRTMFMIGVVSAALLTSAGAVNATPTKNTIYVDGTKVNGAAYMINNNNYFKLRDVAAMVNGSTKQFEVSWNETNKRIDLTMICTPFTGHPVEGVLLCGTHMSTKGNV